MAKSPYQKIAIGEMKGWIREELLHLFPPHFFKDPIKFANEDGGQCVRESKWRWAGFLDLSGGRRVFLKRDLTKDWMESLKYLIFPSKGRKEWFIAYQSGKRHLNVPTPLGWLERVHRGWVKESYYLSEAIKSGVSLTEATDILRDEKVSTKLVKTVIRMHASGLLHQDLHAGNFLWDGESFYLIDLHRARILRSLSLNQKLWNLAQLFHSLRYSWGEREYEKFFYQYFEGDPISSQKKKEYLQKVYSWMDRLQKRQWKSRTKRCLKESTDFSVVRKEGITYYHRKDFPPDHIKTAIKRHLEIAQESPSRLVKRDSNVIVSIFDNGKGKICVKQFCYLKVWDALRERFLRSKGLKAWLGGNGLRVRGIPSVQLLGLVEKKKGLVNQESFLIMEAPEDGEEMDRFLCRGFERINERKSFIEAFACWFSTLHRKEIYHLDMKACNVLVSKKNHGWDFKLLDLEDIRFNEKVKEKKLFKNILQLNTSIPKFITLKDRLRFFRGYLKRFPILKDKKVFLIRLIKKSRERGIVYVSPYGIVEEKFH